MEIPPVGVVAVLLHTATAPTLRALAESTETLCLPRRAPTAVPVATEIAAETPKVHRVPLPPPLLSGEASLGRSVILASSARLLPPALPTTRLRGLALPLVFPFGFELVPADDTILPNGDTPLAA